MRPSAAVFAAAAFVGVRAQVLEVPPAFSAICPEVGEFLSCASVVFNTVSLPCPTNPTSEELLECGCEVLDTASQCVIDNCGSTALRLAQNFCANIVQDTTVEVTTPTGEATTPTGAATTPTDEVTTPTATETTETAAETNETPTQTGDDAAATDDTAAGTTDDDNGAASLAASGVAAVFFAAVVAML